MMQRLKSKMTALIDRMHFSELSRQDPQDVCRRACCRYDAVEAQYILRVWGDDYGVSLKRHEIDCAGSQIPSEIDYLGLFIIHYLLNAKAIEPANRWISEKDIPGGPTFFRGPHAIPTTLISNRFGNDIDAFKATCEQLHGTALDMADAAYRFDMAPRIPIAVLYWLGDDDFPAEAKVLYDRTIANHLASDIVYALGVAICRRL